MVIIGTILNEEALASPPLSYLGIFNSSMVCTHSDVYTPLCCICDGKKLIKILYVKKLRAPVYSLPTVGILHRLLAEEKVDMLVVFQRGNKIRG